MKEKSFSRRLTLGAAYNEHPAITNRFLLIKITDSHVKQFGYYDHPRRTSTSFVVVVSGTVK